MTSSSCIRSLLCCILYHASAGQSPPHLVHRTGDLHQILPFGSTATLPCPVQSESSSLFFEWYKDKIPLTPFAGHRVRVLNSGALRIKDVSPEDTGVYVCRAVNGFGSVEVNVTLIVIEDEDDSSQNLYPDQATDHSAAESPMDEKKPALSGVHPVNTTVEYGGVATLECGIRSDQRPQVLQWLKRSEGEEEDQKNVVSLHGENYKVIKTSDAVAMPDGSLFSKLTILEASEKDSGKYVCLGANALGYTFRGSFLTVLPKSPESKSPLPPPFPVVVTACVLGGALVGCLLLLWFFWRKKRKSGEKSTQDEVSMETKEALVSQSAPHGRT